MHIIKRDGRQEIFDIDKLKARVRTLCFGLDSRFVDVDAVVQTVIKGIYDGVTTAQLDNLAAETAAYRTVSHPDYARLAGRLAVSHLHHGTDSKFSTVVHKLYNHINPYNGESAPLVSRRLYETSNHNFTVLDSALKHHRDFDFHYFGFKTLERAYLIREASGRIIERPQHMFMRVAIAIHGNQIEQAIETYNLISSKYLIHASSTLFNAGCPPGQLSPCFLSDMSDSVDEIFGAIKNCAQIAKSGGGIGLNVHNIRATGSYIAGTGGQAKGIVPMLRVLNDVVRYIEQGNKRPSSIAVYLEPWHADIIEFLDLRKNHGKEERRARDLFYALWIPDLFMERVEGNGHWTLFCPKEAPGLADVWGEKFKVLYEEYEKAGIGRTTMRAQDLWSCIIAAQIETGNPFMLYKDACNAKSNQQNLGCIKSSNLCTEIVEFSSPEEIAVCNLASLGLPAFVDMGEDAGNASKPLVFNFQKLHAVTQVVVRNLDKIIDVNHYPLKQAEVSNTRHRPVAVGVQGLADVFLALRIPFESAEARQLNIRIFETIYHAALSASCMLARAKGPYVTYDGSPISKGILQYDMWEGVKPTDLWDWASLRRDIARFGVRNSLLVAPMPTASTSQILGFNESTEPYTSNIYSRRVLSGEFQIVNHWLIRELASLRLWDDTMKNRIIADGGSIQSIQTIPAATRALFKTVWEIPQRTILQLATDRAPFIDQSQSLNIHLANPTKSQVTSMHFAGWKAGLKTGMYYLRTQAASAPIQFTVDAELLRLSKLQDFEARKGSRAFPEMVVAPRKRRCTSTESDDASSSDGFNETASAAGSPPGRSTEASSPPSEPRYEGHGLASTPRSMSAEVKTSIHRDGSSEAQTSGQCPISGLVATGDDEEICLMCSG